MAKLILAIALAFAFVAPAALASERSLQSCISLESMVKNVRWNLLDQEISHSIPRACSYVASNVMSPLEFKRHFGKGGTYFHWCRDRQHFKSTSQRIQNIVARCPQFAK